MYSSKTRICKEVDESTSQLEMVSTSGSKLRSLGGKLYFGLFSGGGDVQIGANEVDVEWGNSADSG